MVKKINIFLSVILISTIALFVDYSSIETGKVKAATSANTLSATTYLGDEQTLIIDDGWSAQGVTAVPNNSCTWKIHDENDPIAYARADNPPMFGHTDINGLYHPGLFDQEGNDSQTHKDFTNFIQLAAPFNQEGSIPACWGSGESGKPWNSTITITYPAKIGTYKGKAVKATIVLSHFVFTKQYNEWTDPDFVKNAIVCISKSKLRIQLSGIKSVEAKMTLYYVDSGEKVNVSSDDAIYLGFGELWNDGGGTEGISSAQASNLYLTPDSIMKFGNISDYVNVAYNNSPTTIGYQPGTVEEPKNSVYLKYSNASDFNFVIIDTVGHLLTNIKSSGIGWWNPGEPTKYVLDSANKRQSQASFKTGDTVSFEVDQKINQTNVNISGKYSSFIMSDTLPKELEYTSLEVYQGNTNITSNGTISFDSSTNTVTWTAKTSYLNSMSLSGQTFTMKLKTKAISPKSSVQNTAKTIINGNSLTTKPVTITITPPDPTKSVSSKYVNDLTTFTYRVKQSVPGPNRSDTDISRYLYKSFTLTDVLDNAFDMDKTTAKVIDTSDGSDKGYFTININKTNRTVTATAKADSLTKAAFYGKTYELVISTKVKQEYDFTNYSKDSNGYAIIKNKATRAFTNKDGTSYTKETSEVPTSYVGPNAPTKEVDTEQIRVGKDFNYTIKKIIQPATEDNYYTSFIFTDTLEVPLKITSLDKIKIVDNNNTNWTTKFDIKLGEDGQTIIATLINPKDTSFYGTRDTNGKEIPKTYSFILPVTLKENLTGIDMNKYLDDGRYIIPNIATFTIDNKSIPTNEVIVYNYLEPDTIKTTKESNITSIYNKQ